MIAVLLLVCIPSFGGDKVEGAKLLLLDSASKEIYRTVETDETGAFYFPEVTPGTYILSIRIPISSFRENERDKMLLDRMVDGGCDVEKGRLVFKLRYNCFVVDVDCEEVNYSKLTPYFSISEEDDGFLITIAHASIYKKFTLNGLFQLLSAENYKRCLAGGSFHLL